MEFRKATENDFPSIWEIILQAKQQMQAENRSQWNENYPIPATIYGDIEKGIGYVLENEGQVIAYSAISFDEDPAYKSISGKWLTESPYSHPPHCSLRHNEEQRHRHKDAPRSRTARREQRHLQHESRHKIRQQPDAQSFPETGHAILW